MLGDQAWGSDVPSAWPEVHRHYSLVWLDRTMLDCQDGAWHSSRIVSKWFINQGLPMATLMLSPVVCCPVQQKSLSQEKGGGV
jgi:hypothetical protein